jgi:hypothetical protein
MYYPPEMTAEEIREFELEMNDLIDAENKAYYDSLERDHDEPDADYNDSWYEEQYDLGDY